MELGMVGLGRMGGNMTQRLLKGGHSIVAYDPGAEAVEAVEALGARAGNWARVCRGRPTTHPVTRKLANITGSPNWRNYFRADEGVLRRYRDPPATAGTTLISSPSLVSVFRPFRNRTSSPFM